MLLRKRNHDFLINLDVTNIEIKSLIEYEPD